MYYTKLPIDTKYYAEIDGLLSKIETYYPEHQIYAFDSLCSDYREKLSKVAKANGIDYKDILQEAGYVFISPGEVSKVRTKTFLPGSEPEPIKQKVSFMLKNLNEYYPGKTISVSIASEHGKFAEKLSGLYMWLGYSSLREMLAAYGWDYNPSITREVKLTKDALDSLADSLIVKVAQRGKYNTVGEMEEDNLDVNFTSFKQKSVALTGQSFAEYLKAKGIVAEASEKPRKMRNTDGTIAALKQKCANGKKYGMLIDVFGDNPELKNDIIYMQQNATELFGCTLAKHLEKIGIITKTEPIVKQVDTSSYNPEELLIVGTVVKDSATKSKVVVVPQGVTKIGASAFYSNPVLEKVVLPSSVKQIMMSAFSKCPNLKEVVLPNGIEYLGAYIFLDCPNLTKLHIPSSVTEICASGLPTNAEITLEPDNGYYSIKEDCIVKGNTLVKYMGTAENYVVPSFCNQVGEYAFYGNNRLKRVVVPPFVSSVGRKAFSGCSALEECYFQGSLKELPRGMFCDCKSLKEVVLPDGIKKLPSEYYFGMDVSKIGWPKSLSLNELKESGYKSVDEVYIKGNSADISIENVFAEENYREFYFYSADKPSVIGRFWHFVDGRMAKWDPVDEAIGTSNVSVSDGNIEFVDFSKNYLDAKHNVIVSDEGSVYLRDKRYAQLVSGKTVSAYSARRIAHAGFGMNKFIDKYCKWVEFDTASPNAGIINAKSVKQIPLCELQKLLNNKISICDGKIEVNFVENCDGVKYAYVDMTDLDNLPESGKITIPMRFRLSSGDIPTKDNLRGEGGFLFNRTDYLEFGALPKFAFEVGESKYKLNVGLRCYNIKTTRISKCEIGQDSSGSYIDALVMCVRYSSFDEKYRDYFSYDDYV